MPHAFGANKKRFGEQLEALIGEAGMEPMIVALLGSTDKPPLWQHAEGWDFSVGNTLRSKKAAGRLTNGERSLLRLLWKRAFPCASLVAAAPWKDKTPEMALPMGTVKEAHVQLPRTSLGHRMKIVYETTLQKATGTT